jgi:ribosomal protein S6
MAEKRRVSCRDIPGRTREYETIFILKPDVTNEVIGATNTKIRGVVEAGAAPCSRLKTGDAANLPTR